METKTHTWLKYNQHKIQHAAHSRHGSSRVNRIHNIPLMNNTDQVVKTECNIWLSTHTHTHTHRSSRINGTQNMSLMNNTYRSVKTQHMAHQTQRSSRVNRRHDTQCMKNTDQAICPRHNMKFMTYTEYWSQTSLWVMPWLVFSKLKKPPYMLI
jgi:hypothetical protein